jgi:GxxExxY protein
MQQISLFLEKKLSRKLIGIFIEISKENGNLFKEKAYYTLLINKFTNAGIKYLQFPELGLYSNEYCTLIDHFYPDFLIENKIILEVKASGQIRSVDIDQLTEYLHCSKYELGFIVNFGTPRVQFERRIYTNDRKPFLKFVLPVNCNK